MKTNYFLLGMTIVLVFSFSACSNNEEKDEPVNNTNNQETEIDDNFDPLERFKKSVMPSEEDISNAAKANNFALKLLKEQMGRTEKDENFIFSPLGAVYELGILHAGADEQTQLKIRGLLGFGNDEQAINLFCNKMMTWGRHLENNFMTQNLTNLCCINRDQSLLLNHEYRTLLESCFYAKAEAFQFSSEDAIEDIETWLNEKTDGMTGQIDGLFSNNDPFVFFNSIGFNGIWFAPFDPELTAEEDFTLSDGTVGKVTMMHQDDVIYKGNSDKCENYVIPYGFIAYGLVLARPWDRNMSLKEMVEGFTEQDIYAMTHGWDKGLKAGIAIPKLDVAGDNDLKGLLVSMGLPQTVNMSKAGEGMENIALGAFKQKAALRMTEDALEKEIYWNIEVKQTLQGEQIKFDRPFLYMVVDRITGAIVLMGTYMGD